MINYEITEQNYELIRDRIMSILVTEFNNQVVNYYNTDCDLVEFYAERFIPIDNKDKSFINITLDKGGYGNKHSGSHDGTYTYFIDVFTNAKATGASAGDKISSVKMHRIMGIVRAILEDSQYKVLLFSSQPRFIMRTEILGFESLAMKDGNDALHSKVGRITFEVKANESTPFQDGVFLDSAVTQVRLGISDKGLKYEIGDAGPNPPLDSRYVYIIDQYGNVLELLVGGERYDVTVLKRIVDSFPNNELNVIDNIP